MFENMNEQPPVRPQEEIKPLSASATKIAWRDIGEPVALQLNNRQFFVRAAPIRLWNTIKQRILEERQARMTIASTAANILGVLSRAEKRQKSGKTTLTAEEYKELSDGAGLLRTYVGQKLEIDSSEITLMLRVVQLILLDGADHDWMDKYQGFPPDEVLDQVIPLSVLENKVPFHEIATIIDVYQQINDPENSKKNFLKIAGMAMI